MFQPHVTVATIVQRNERFLLVEEQVEGRLVYNQPAGHLEDGESLIQAAIRETLEETGWQVEPLALVGIYRWRRPDTGETFVRFTFAARTLLHDPGRTLDEEIQQVVWLDREELFARQGQLRSPLVLRCVDDFLSGHSYPLGLLQDF